MGPRFSITYFAKAACHRRTSSISGPSGVRLALHKLMHIQVPNVVGFIEEGKKVAKKQMDITLHGLWGKGVQTPLQAGISPLSLVCMLSHTIAGQKACRLWGAPSKDG